jgi:hypothetical protein
MRWVFTSYGLYIPVRIFSHSLVVGGVLSVCTIFTHHPFKTARFQRYEMFVPPFSAGKFKKTGLK